MHIATQASNCKVEQQLMPICVSLPRQTVSNLIEVRGFRGLTLFSPCDWTDRVVSVNLCIF